jgi:hypothetical protein
MDYPVRADEIIVNMSCTVCWFLLRKEMVRNGVKLMAIKNLHLQAYRFVIPQSCGPKEL